MSDRPETLLDRFIPQSQLTTYGPEDLPTFFRWYFPIRVSVLSRDESIRSRFEEQVVKPLMEEFRQASNFDIALSDDQSKTNLLLIIGESPVDDFLFFQDPISKVSKGPHALESLVQDVRKGEVPCYRIVPFVKQSVTYAVLYTPSPTQDEYLAAKCFAVNFAVAVGLIGKPKDGLTVTNIKNRDTSFTGRDKFALRVLYDQRFRPHMTLGEIDRTVAEILSEIP